MRELDKANCAESVGSITTSMRCKLAIRDVTHHSEEECTPSDNEGSLSSLSRRVVVEVTVMEETHEEFIPALMNLI